MRFTPIEKLQAAWAAAVDRRARQRLDPSQGIVREPIHFVAFFEALDGVGAAADTARMSRKQKAAVSVQECVVRTRPAVALRALIHIGPQQFFEPRAVDADQALPAFMAGHYGGYRWSQSTPDLRLRRHLPDIIHRIAIINALSFDTGWGLKEKPNVCSAAQLDFYS